MPEIDVELFNTWKNCGKESGNRFLEFYYTSHFMILHDRRQADDREGAIIGSLLIIWQNFRGSRTSSIMNEELPWAEAELEAGNHNKARLLLDRSIKIDSVNAYTLRITARLPG